MARRREAAEHEQALAAMRRRGRIRADLERRGVAPEFSQPVAQRLALLADNLTPAEYKATLNGVAAAYGVHADERPATKLVGKTLGEAVRKDLLTGSSADPDELQRLVTGFAGELRKLDEGLRILSAYLTRMRRGSRRRAPNSRLH